MLTANLIGRVPKPLVEHYADEVRELMAERERLFELLTRTQGALRAARHRLDDLLAHVRLQQATPKASDPR